MDHSTLQCYIRKINSMNRSQSESNGYAPDKPFLMLAVIQLIEQGKISENRISPSEDLIAIFRKYISLMPWSNSTIHVPFDELKNEGFWQLENRLSTSVSQMGLFSSAETTALTIVRCAVLDDALFSCLMIPEYRELIRQNIIETYFPELRQKIEKFDFEESAEAKTYSETLISGAEDKFERFKCSKLIREKPPVRSAGFRRAIMKIYDYTCAICGLNILAPSRESVTDAAHIIPFSVSCNDDIRNGMSLCKSHHWAFDTGLIAVNKDYEVIVSPDVTEEGPTGAKLIGLRNKSIFKRLPKKKKYHPHQDALAWHRENVYKRGQAHLINKLKEEGILR